MNELGPYTPPLSVWRLVEESVAPEKLPVVRSCLGESKIDYCNDLRFELETLLEIWNDITERSYRHPSKRASSLPEPPHQRELLTKEIRLLIKSLEEKENDGRISLDCKPSVLIYAKQSSALQVSYGDRPSTPMRSSSQKNLCAPSLCDHELSDAIKNVSILDADKPIEVLKNALQNESDILTEDIEFLRSCVEEGHNFAVDQPVEEPSIAELRNERSKLEKQLLKDTVLTPKPKQDAIRYKASHFPSNLLPDMYDPRPPTPQTLPPVRARSACGHSIRQHVSEFDLLNVTDQIVGDYMHSTSAYEDFVAASANSSRLLLGERSSTFPVKTLKKSSVGLPRAKSHSSVAEYPISTDNLEQYCRLHSPVENSKSPIYRSASYNTTDSGMSSRPASGFALSCDDTECTSVLTSSVEPSEYKIENSVLLESTVPNEFTLEQGNVDLNLDIPKQFPSIDSVSSFCTIHNSGTGVLTYTAIPSPPQIEKPQNFGRLNHRMRSANSAALK